LSNLIVDYFYILEDLDGYKNLVGEQRDFYNQAIASQRELINTLNSELSEQTKRLRKSNVDSTELSEEKDELIEYLNSSYREISEKTNRIMEYQEYQLKEYKRVLGLAISKLDESDLEIERIRKEYDNLLKIKPN